MNAKVLLATVLFFIPMQAQAYDGPGICIARIFSSASTPEAESSQRRMYELSDLVAKNGIIASRDISEAIRDACAIIPEEVDGRGTLCNKTGEDLSKVMHQRKQYTPQEWQEIVTATVLFLQAVGDDVIRVQHSRFCGAGEQATAFRSDAGLIVLGAGMPILAPLAGPGLMRETSTKQETIAGVVQLVALSPLFAAYGAVGLAGDAAGLVPNAVGHSFSSTKMSESNKAWRHFLKITHQPDDSLLDGFVR